MTVDTFRRDSPRTATVRIVSYNSNNPQHEEVCVTLWGGTTGQLRQLEAQGDRSLGTSLVPAMAQAMSLLSSPQNHVCSVSSREGQDTDSYLQRWSWCFDVDGEHQ
jgi:hypothetical protein